MNSRYDDGPRFMDNGLINGKNTWGVQGTHNRTGERFELPVKFKPGETYLLRLINGAVQGTYRFLVDGHGLEVISMEFTSIVFYKTDITTKLHAPGPLKDSILKASFDTLKLKTHIENLFKWHLSGTTFYSKQEDPTLVRVIANNIAPTYSGNLILDLPNMGEWIYIVVQSAIPLNHPIHLHGHDFLILGAGKGTYTNQERNMFNPLR
ncbi:hypothetical protein N0V94_003278 [Neodidymelliopsis sp. IMI 364377]|nr:hypothetical protein N0V94_003278 [Neodidymelliopsis sp. IMI 364377]